MKNQIYGVLLLLAFILVAGCTGSPGPTSPNVIASTPIPLVTATPSATPGPKGDITFQWVENGPAYCSWSITCDTGDTYSYVEPVSHYPTIQAAFIWYGVPNGVHSFMVDGYPVTETLSKPDGASYYMAVTLHCNSAPGIGWN